MLFKFRPSTTYRNVKYTFYVCLCNRSSSRWDVAEKLWKYLVTKHNLNKMAVRVVPIDNGYLFRAQILKDGSFRDYWIINKV